MHYNQSSTSVKEGNHMGKVRLNEDREVVALIQEGLKRTGGFKAQIRDPNFEGYCHCRLYYKEK